MRKGITKRSGEEAGVDTETFWTLNADNATGLPESHIERLFARGI